MGLFIQLKGRHRTTSRVEVQSAIAAAGSAGAAGILSAARPGVPTGGIRVAAAAAGVLRAASAARLRCPAAVALITLVTLVTVVLTHEESPDISIDENGKETLRNGRASDLPVPIGAQRTLRGQRLRGSVEVFAKTTQ